MKRGDAGRAVDLLTKSIKAAPKNASLLELMVKLHISQKDWVSAEAVVSTLKKLPQGETAAHILEGVLAQKQGQFQQAISIYNGILSSHSNNGIALKGLAQSYQADGHQKEWIDYLKIFSKQNPKNIEALNMLGRAYSRSGGWDEAEKVLQQALQIESKSSVTYSLLAAVLMQQGKIDEVTEIYRLGLQSLPENTELLMKLAKQYERTKQFEKAVSIYDGLIERFPDGLEIVNNLAYILVTFNANDISKKRALSLVERFKDEQNPYWLDTYGWVLFKAGHTKIAIASLQKAVAGVQGNATMHYHLAEALYAAGEIEMSKSEVEKVLSLSSLNKPFNEIEQAIKLSNKLKIEV